MALSCLSIVHHVEYPDRPASMIPVNMAQGSPNTQQTVESKESYRHSLAVTGMRPGLKGTPYLYTLNLSCPEERWEELFPYYQQAIDSFRLVQPNQVILSTSQPGHYSVRDGCFGECVRLTHFQNR